MSSLVGNAWSPLGATATLRRLEAKETWRFSRKRRLLPKHHLIRISSCLYSRLAAMTGTAKSRRSGIQENTSSNVNRCTHQPHPFTSLDL